MTEQEQGILEFAPDRSTAGFRLHTCSVLNWGTFHGKIHTFAPEGRTALLSGGNAAGKSTLADAMLTLLIDSRKRNYNQASGAGGGKKERSEKDYILGAYSEKHDSDLGRGKRQTLRRPGETVTVLLARFYNENFNGHVTLAQVLWINSAGKVERAFIAERRSLTIEGDFSNLGGPSEVRARLRGRGIEPLDTFAAYSQRFHEYLFLSRTRSPMDIFNQAICIKDIANLTQFIRDYMLDDGGAGEKLDNLRRNFEELRLTYRRIETEKHRLQVLDRIHLSHEAILEQEKEVAALNACYDSMPVFFAEKELGLRSAERDRLAAAHAKSRADQEIADSELTKQRETISTLQSAIEESAEGRRLQEIEKETARLEEKIGERKPRRLRFEEKLRQWRPNALLDSVGDFRMVMADSAKELPEMREQRDSLQAKINQTKAGIAKNQEEQDKVNAEIRYLLERQSNISSTAAQHRSRIAKAIGVAENKLPFVGELLQVREEEERWTGAIERLIHDFAISILIPEEFREKVDAYVHAEDQQGVVFYQVVSGVNSTETLIATASGTVAAKLQIHPDSGTHGQWLAHELSQRFDHLCFEEPGENFYSNENAITINGLVREGVSGRRKDDSFALGDRTHYVLGWDNRAKIRALEKQKKSMEMDERELQSELDRLRETVSALASRISAAEGLPNIASEWQEIDWQSLSLEIETLRKEEKALRQGSDKLRVLKEQLETAREREKQAKARLEVAQKTLGGIEQQQKQNLELLENCQSILDAADESAASGNDPRVVYPKLREMLAFPLTSLQDLPGTRASLEKQLGGERNVANNRRNQLIEHAKLDMKGFLDQIRNEDARLHDELVSADLQIPGYSAALYQPYGHLRQRILEDDLPKNEQRFERLLHTNIIEEVANFDGLLQNHAYAIQKRIEDLNGHLRQIDFDRNRGTYIQLAPMRTNDENQKRFRTMRQYALENITRQEHSADELRESYKRVEHLLTELEKDEAWTRRVIDVRNWFEFRADEIRRADDEVYQSYSGSSGKSGGEKNRLASTILATSIAYQYGISVNERQSDTFRLVVVDEMFSKTDDEFSTYLLELFREFSLQLIIIQPLDSKIHLVQKYVERYHIVTRSGDHSSIRNLTVQEYKAAMAEFE